MNSNEPAPPPAPDAPLQPSPLTRARGELVAWGQRRLGGPARRRVPIDRCRRLHRLRRRLAPHRYTDADPFTVVAVDPTAIDRSILETVPWYPQWGRVQGGDWDRRSEPFTERPVPRAIRAHYEDDVPWVETPLPAHFAEQLRRFGAAWGDTSFDGFERRCARIEGLYRSMRRHGYRRQSELAARGESTAVPVFDEITVDVARDGTLCWRSYGQHRLAIARVLGLERVPVVIQRRHRQWQALRDAVRRSGRVSRPVSAQVAWDPPETHPDLRGLLEGNAGERR